jgi:hypothetical protein
MLVLDHLWAGGKKLAFKRSILALLNIKNSFQTPSSKWSILIFQMLPDYQPRQMLHYFSIG